MLRRSWANFEYLEMVDAHFSFFLLIVCNSNLGNLRKLGIAWRGEGKEYQKSAPTRS